MNPGTGNQGGGEKGTQPILFGTILALVLIDVLIGGGAVIWRAA